MDRNDPTPRYTRGELLEAMELGAGVASGVFMRKHPGDVMPSEELSQGIERVLEDFDIRRGRVQRAEEEVERVRSETRIGYPRSDELEPRTYARAELDLVALLAAEQATVGALPPQGEKTLWVTTEAEAAARVALAAFDEHRGRAG